LVDLPALARQAVATWHPTGEAAQLTAERRMVEQLSAELRVAGQPRLARLLELQVGSGPPLLVNGVRAAVPNAVAKGDALRQSLPWACAGAAPPAVQALDDVIEVFDRHSRRLAEVLESRGSGLDSRGGPLDLFSELPRLNPALQPLAHDVLSLLNRHQL